MNWMRKLGRALSGEAEDREDLSLQLRQAADSGLIDADALRMLEGVLGVAELQVRDIMVPRAQMDVIDVNEPPDRFIPLVIETAHSRFPVYGETIDSVIGMPVRRSITSFASRSKRTQISPCCARSRISTAGSTL